MFIRRFFQTFFLVIFAAVSTGLPIFFAYADTLSSVEAQPSSLVVSQGANQKFLFTTVSAWTDGETLTITFPSGYTTTSITEDDVDIADDGVDKTTAATCTGTEEMSVAMAANVLTLTVCSGDGGSVGAGSAVVIEVGRNASSSGNGTQQITNPSNQSSYFIDIGGTFGDGGSVIVPIVATDSSGVSTTVPSSSSGGSGGGGGGGGTVGGGDDSDSGDEVDEGTDEPDPGTDEGTDETDPTDPGIDEETPGEDGTPEGDPGSTDTGSDTSGDASGDSSSSGEDSSSGDDASSGTDSEGGEDTSGGAGSLSEQEIDLGIYAYDLPLAVTDDGVSVLPGTTATVVVFLPKEEDAEKMVLEIGPRSYAFVEVPDGSWSIDVVLPQANIPGVIRVTDTDGSTRSARILFDVIGEGGVYEILEGSTQGIEGAEVTVLSSNGLIWDGAAYEQSPILLTNNQGNGIAWYVPNGMYQVRVTKQGYEETTVFVTVTNTILAPTIFLERTDEVVVPPEEGEQTGTGELSVTDSPGISELKQETFFESLLPDFLSELPVLPETFLPFLSEEDAQTVQDVAVPAVAVATVAVTAASGATNLGLLLYSFFTQPLLFLSRRRNRQVSIAYNSATKMPLDLVTIRVFASETGRLVKTLVTNEKGEFFLSLNKIGKYRLEAMKTGFVFPSEHFKEVREDGKYQDVYAGQEIEIGEGSPLIAISMPLDPEGVDIPMKQLQWQRFKRRFATALSPMSVLVAFIAFLATPVFFTGMLFFAQILFWAIAWRLTHKKRPMSWGIVYDAQTRKPVGNTVIRLFEPQYNKLVESTLSDAQGRYAFLLGPNAYFATYRKDGYVEATVRPIDYRAKTEPQIFGVAVPLGRDQQKHG